NTPIEKMAQKHLLRGIFQPAARISRLHVLRTPLQTRLASTEIKLEGVYDNEFNRQRLAVKKHAAESADLWRKLCIYVCIPAVVLAGLNAWNLWNEHWEHWEHMPPLEERIQYPYMNIRTKKFFWGDGDKTLL
ncbi:MAG: hypothetical protein Q9167_005291, partial [Letrouitia subvulpina]